MLEVSESRPRGSTLYFLDQQDERISYGWMLSGFEHYRIDVRGSPCMVGGIDTQPPGREKRTKLDRYHGKHVY
jgi:hypothetical protein